MFYQSTSGFAPERSVKSESSDRLIPHSTCTFEILLRAFAAWEKWGQQSYPSSRGHQILYNIKPPREKHQTWSSPVPYREKQPKSSTSLNDKFHLYNSHWLTWHYSADWYQILEITTEYCHPHGRRHVFQQRSYPWEGQGISYSVTSCMNRCPSPVST